MSDDRGKQTLKGNVLPTQRMKNHVWAESVELLEIRPNGSIHIVNKPVMNIQADHQSSLWGHEQKIHDFKARVMPDLKNDFGTPSGWDMRQTVGFNQHHDRDGHRFLLYFTCDATAGEEQILASWKSQLKVDSGSRQLIGPDLSKKLFGKVYVACVDNNCVIDKSPDGYLDLKYQHFPRGLGSTELIVKIVRRAAAAAGRNSEQVARPWKVRDDM